MLIFALGLIKRQTANQALPNTLRDESKLELTTYDFISDTRHVVIVIFLPSHFFSIASTKLVFVTVLLFDDEMLLLTKLSVIV